MPLPLTISCSSKSRLVLTFLVLPFWYLLTRVVPDIFQKSIKTVVCVSVCVPAAQPTVSKYITTTTTAVTVLWLFVWDYPGEPVTEETFTHSHLS